MPDLLADHPIDHEQMIRCVHREIRMRRQVYPRWVEAKKMTQELADTEIKTMEAVMGLLERAKEAGFR